MHPKQKGWIFHDQMPAGLQCRYDLLIRNGYIFSGCLPGSLKGDYIILQDLRGKPMDWDKPVLTPGFRKMVDRLRGIADTIM